MTIYRPTVAQEMGGDHSINKASTEVPPGAPSGDYLMLETSAYIFAMKQPRGYTYIGLVKNLINEGEGHIWWKI